MLFMGLTGQETKAVSSSKLVYVLACCLLVLLSFSNLTAFAAADPLEKGMQLARSGKYSDAVQALRGAAPSASNFYYQGYCYHQLKHDPDAKKLFEYVIEHYPSTQEARLAADYLKKMDPSWAPSAPVVPIPSASVAGHTPSQTHSRNPAHSGKPASVEDLDDAESDSGSSAPADMAKLPDQARIFFTPASSGHMIVDATINGHPYKCMFDTGAPGLLFGKNQLKQLGIAPPQGAATTHVSGWAGVALPAWRMNLTVKVGNVERTLPATIQEDFDMQPLIGYSFIKGYQYEIDQKAKCMMLNKKQQSQQAINSLYDVPCRVIGTKPMVPLEANSRQVPVFIDTGAAHTIMNAAEAAAIGIEIPSDAPVYMAGGVGGTSPYRGVNVDLKLGPIIRKEFQILVGGHAGSCVGQDFLQGWRFTVDENKGYMRFFH